MYKTLTCKWGYKVAQIQVPQIKQKKTKDAKPDLQIGYLPDQCLQLYKLFKCIYIYIYINPVTSSFQRHSLKRLQQFIFWYDIHLQFYLEKNNFPSFSLHCIGDVTFLRTM